MRALTFRYCWVRVGEPVTASMALALIGGMTLGTFVSLYFIPLAYWYIYRKQGERG